MAGPDQFVLIVGDGHHGDPHRRGAPYIETANLIGVEERPHQRTLVVGILGAPVEIVDIDRAALPDDEHGFGFGSAMNRCAQTLMTGNGLVPRSGEPKRIEVAAQGGPDLEKPWVDPIPHLRQQEQPLLIGEERQDRLDVVPLRLRVSLRYGYGCGCGCVACRCHSSASRSSN